MAEIVNLHLMPQSQIVSTEHQRPPHPQPPSQKKKSKKEKHTEDYSPPITYIHSDGISPLLTNRPPLPRWEWEALHGESKRTGAEGAEEWEQRGRK